MARPHDLPMSFECIDLQSFALDVNNGAIWRRVSCAKSFDSFYPASGRAGNVIIDSPSTHQDRNIELEANVAG